MRSPADELVSAIIDNRLVPAKILITPHFMTHTPQINIISFRDSSGMTALHLAAHYNKPELIQLFLTTISTYYPM